MSLVSMFIMAARSHKVHDFSVLRSLILCPNLFKNSFSLHNFFMLRFKGIALYPRPRVLHKTPNPLSTACSHPKSSANVLFVSIDSVFCKIIPISLSLQVY